MGIAPQVARETAPVAAVTAPRPRNEPVAVGDRRNGGELKAWRKPQHHRGDRVVVNAAQMAGLTVDVSVAEAREFALGLLELTDPDVLPPAR